MIVQCFCIYSGDPRHTRGEGWHQGSPFEKRSGKRVRLAQGRVEKDRKTRPVIGQHDCICKKYRKMGVRVSKDGLKLENECGSLSFNTLHLNGAFVQQHDLF